MSVIRGTDGNDRLTGDGQSRIVGGKGNDHIIAKGAHQEVELDPGNDRLDFTQVGWRGQISWLYPEEDSWGTPSNGVIINLNAFEDIRAGGRTIRPDQILDPYGGIDTIVFPSNNSPELLFYSGSTNDRLENNSTRVSWVVGLNSGNDTVVGGVGGETNIRFDNVRRLDVDFSSFVDSAGLSTVTLSETSTLSHKGVSRWEFFGWNNGSYRINGDAQKNNFWLDAPNVVVYGGGGADKFEIDGWGGSRNYQVNDFDSRTGDEIFIHGGISDWNLGNSRGADLISRTTVTYNAAANETVFAFNGHSGSNVKLTLLGQHILGSSGFKSNDNGVLAITTLSAVTGRKAFESGGISPIMPDPTPVPIEGLFLYGTSYSDFNDGNDYLIGTPASETINGFTGSDYMEGGGGNDTITGSIGGQTRTATNSKEDWNTVSYTWSKDQAIQVQLGGSTEKGTVKHQTGTDTLIYIDSVIGTSFDDTFTVADNWAGGNFRGYLITQDGTFKRGGEGSLVNIRPGDGNDKINGNGFTRLDYSGNAQAVSVNFSNDGSGTVRYGSNTDTFTGVSKIIGSKGNDNFVGGSGNDIFRPGPGDDTVDGGGGARNRVEYDRSAEGVTVDLRLSGPQFISKSEGRDTLRNIQEIRGSQYDDKLLGSDGGKEFLTAPGGNNFIDGRSGENYMEGGSGNDTITGGTRGNGSLGDFNMVGYDVNLSHGIDAKLIASGGSVKATSGAESKIGVDTLINVDSILGTNKSDKYVIDANWRGGQFSAFDLDSMFVGGNSFQADWVVARAFNEIRGRGGNDVIEGNGFTRISYTDFNSQKSGVSIQLDRANGGSVSGVDNSGNPFSHSFTGINTIRGTSKGDVVDAGGYGKHLIFQVEGDDTVTGSRSDHVTMVDFRRVKDNQDASLGVTVNLQIQTPQQVNKHANVTLVDVDAVRGSDGNDQLLGNNKNNWFNGGQGSDRIDGKGGTNTYITALRRDDVDVKFETNGNVVLESREGRKELTNIQYILFADQKLSVSSGAGVGDGGNDNFDEGLVTLNIWRALNEIESFLYDEDVLDDFEPINDPITRDLPGGKTSYTFTNPTLKTSDRLKTLEVTGKIAAVIDNATDEEISLSVDATRAKVITPHVAFEITGKLRDTGTQDTFTSSSKFTSWKFASNDTGIVFTFSGSFEQELFEDFQNPSRNVTKQTQDFRKVEITDGKDLVVFHSSKGIKSSEDLDGSTGVVDSVTYRVGGKTTTIKVDISADAIRNSGIERFGSVAEWLSFSGIAKEVSDGSGGTASGLIVEVLDLDSFDGQSLYQVNSSLVLAQSGYEKGATLEDGQNLVLPNGKDWTAPKNAEISGFFINSDGVLELILEVSSPRGSSFSSLAFVEGPKGLVPGRPVKLTSQQLLVLESAYSVDLNGDSQIGDVIFEVVFGDFVSDWGLYLTSAGTLVVAEGGLDEGYPLASDAVSLFLGSGARAKAWTVPKNAEVVGLLSDDMGVSVEVVTVSGPQSKQVYASTSFVVVGAVGAGGKAVKLSLAQVLQREVEYGVDINGDGALGDAVAKDGVLFEGDTWGVYKTAAGGVVIAATGLVEGDGLMDAQAISLVTGVGARAKAWVVPKGVGIAGVLEDEAGGYKVVLSGKAGFTQQGFNGEGVAQGKAVKMSNADLLALERELGEDLTGEGIVGLLEDSKLAAKGQVVSWESGESAYSLYEVSANWVTASKAAQSLGGSLVVLEDEQEAYEVYGEVLDYLREMSVATLKKTSVVATRADKDKFEDPDYGLELLHFVWTGGATDTRGEQWQWADEDRTVIDEGDGLWYDTPVTAKSKALALGYDSQDTAYGLDEAPYVDLAGSTKLFYIVEFAG